MNYFDKKEFISNSMLGWIDKSPSYFISKLNKNIEELESKSLENGTLLHNYIENEKDFVIADVIKPGEKTALFIEEFLRSNRNIEKAKEFSGLSYKTETLETMLQKPENKAYLDFLELSSNKICLTKDQGIKITNAVAALKANPYSHYLLFSDNSNLDIEVYSELEIYFEYRAVQCKSKLDKVIVDHTDKTITVSDLKTTSENPYGKIYSTLMDDEDLNFNYPLDIQYKGTGWFKSFINYRYYRQGTFYLLAAKEHFKDLIFKKGYTLKFMFIPVELGNSYDIAIYQLKPQGKFILFGTQEIQDLLNKYKTFKENNFRIEPKIIEI